MWHYLYVFIAEMVVVTLMTMRVVFITKGERKIGAGIAFVEVTIWALVIGNVIGGVSEDPLIAIAYSLGYAAGSFFGSAIEEKLGLGTIELKVIVKEHHGKELANALRNKGYGITVMPAEGKDIPRQVLTIFTNRKGEKKLASDIIGIQKNAVITRTDIKPVYGGYF